MKIRQRKFEPLKNFSGSCWTVWGEFFSDMFGVSEHKYNWHTFDIIQLEIDWERYLGNISIRVCLLGFGFYVGYQYTDLENTDGGRKLLKSMKEVEDGKVGPLEREDLEGDVNDYKEPT